MRVSDDLAIIAAFLSWLWRHNESFAWQLLTFRLPFIPFKQ